ncbi:hypothetical protein MRX96_035507 [Rhipicephalus microplus]
MPRATSAGRGNRRLGAKPTYAPDAGERIPGSLARGSGWDSLRTPGPPVQLWPGEKRSTVTQRAARERRTSERSILVGAARPEKALHFVRLCTVARVRRLGLPHSSCLAPRVRRILLLHHSLVVASFFVFVAVLPFLLPSRSERGCCCGACCGRRTR